MKSSPLRLKGVHYPSISYEALSEHKGDGARILPVTVAGSVRFGENGRHFAYLRISQNNEEGVYQFKVNIDAFSSFEVNADVAKQVYRDHANMPFFLAVNVIRMLYSGAREMIATLTARAPYGPAELESALIEISDVRVEFFGEKNDPDAIRQKLFPVENIVEPEPKPRSKRKTKKLD